MKYTAITPVSVAPGARVRLTKEQAARCIGLVDAPEKKGGFSTVLIAFQFKAGEAFELDADLPKGMADQVQDTAAEPTASAPVAAAPAQAAAATAAPAA